MQPPLTQTFIDIEFPPVGYSIGRLGKNGDQTGFDRMIEWRRPCDFLPQGEFTDPITLFPIQPIQPVQMAKGILRNEHFHSAIAAILLKNENLIKRLFETKEFNEEGVYKLKICDTGRWRIVTIDDFTRAFCGHCEISANLR